MSSLWFVMPAWRRVELTELCLEQLAGTCTDLEAFGVSATCVVVADDENLETARALGFWTVERENQPLGRKFNDGFQLACEQGADWVMPIGSDNWITALAASQLPDNPRAVLCRRHCTIVHENGDRLAELEITYDGGDGIRKFPAELFRAVGGRPASEHARRAIDTSILENLRRKLGWSRQFEYRDMGTHQIIGWQSPDVQLNDYDALVRAFGRRESFKPWEELLEVFPARDMISRMRTLFESRAMARRAS